MTPSAYKIEVRRDSRGVAYVTYDHARRLNVLGPQALGELAETFHALAKGR